MSITCGIDWAEVHHDVALVDAGGTTVAKLRTDTGLLGFTALMALIAEHSDEPTEVVVAIETDKNLIVAALQAAASTPSSCGAGHRGSAPSLAARVLGEVGDDTTRFSTAGGLRAFAGTAPIARASGRSKSVRTRHVKNKRLADACHWWAFAAITKSPGARAHHDRRRAAGDSHDAALRTLANKLLGRLWCCLLNDLAWDDDAAWPAFAKAREQAAA